MCSGIPVGGYRVEQGEDAAVLESEGVEIREELEFQHEQPFEINV